MLLAEPLFVVSEETFNGDNLNWSCLWMLMLLVATSGAAVKAEATDMPCQIPQHANDEDQRINTTVDFIMVNVG